MAMPGLPEILIETSEQIFKKMLAIEK